MHIRRSLNDENNTIYQLHLKAFGEEEGPAVAQLVLDLMTAEDAQPMLSLVAEADDTLTGHILFTPVAVPDLPKDSVYILCPLAVAPEKHKQGVGTALIERGLESLRQQGVRAVLVLGDPNYYSRTGFHANHKIDIPYAIDYPEAWMAQELQTGALDAILGKAQCAAPLNDPKHW